MKMNNFIVDSIPISLDYVTTSFILPFNFMSKETKDDIVEIQSKVNQHDDFHVEHIRKTLQRMGTPCLKLNLFKCAFNVQAWNILDFFVHKRLTIE